MEPVTTNDLAFAREHPDVPIIPGPYYWQSAMVIVNLPPERNPRMVGMDELVRRTGRSRLTIWSGWSHKIDFPRSSFRTEFGGAHYWDRARVDEWMRTRAPQAVRRAWFGGVGT